MVQDDFGPATTYAAHGERQFMVARTISVSVRQRRVHLSCLQKINTSDCLVKKIKNEKDEWKGERKRMQAKYVERSEAKRSDANSTQLLCVKWLFMASVQPSHIPHLAPLGSYQLAPARPSRGLKCCPLVGHFVAAFWFFSTFFYTLHLRLQIDSWP